MGNLEWVVREDLTVNKKELLKLDPEGKKFGYYFFWNGFLSQFHPSPFVVNGIKYPAAEYWMMAEKARCFDDQETLKAILKAARPIDAKNLGRSVRNYNEQKWENKRYSVVIQGNIYKFSRNKHLRDMLMDTGEQVLVEASPTDKIWGIGLAETHPNARVPCKWPGKNLLGFALMEVRDYFKDEKSSTQEPSQ